MERYGGETWRASLLSVPVPNGDKFNSVGCSEEANETLRRMRKNEPTLKVSNIHHGGVRHLQGRSIVLTFSWVTRNAHPRLLNLSPSATTDLTNAQYTTSDYFDVAFLLRAFFAGAFFALAVVVFLARVFLTVFVP